MITYILILAMQNSGPAITSVPGFKTRAECKAAGDEVKSEIDGYNIDYVCVKQRK